MAADPQDLADDAAEAAVDLLNALRKETIAALLAAEPHFQQTYRMLLREISDLITTFERQLTRDLATHIERAANNGDESVLDDARAAGIEIPLSYVGVSPTLVRTASEYVADLVTGLSNEARRDITREVRLAALGGTPFGQLMDRIGRNLKDKSVFTTLAARAEAIARTEVSRVHSMAHAEQGAELAARYPGMQKKWVHSVQAPRATGHQRRMARQNHIRVAERTAAKPIPWAADFDLGGGIKAPYPHHPLLPASESVHCRCRVVMVAPEPED